MIDNEFFIASSRVAKKESFRAKEKDTLCSGNPELEAFFAMVTVDAGANQSNEDLCAVYIGMAKSMVPAEKLDAWTRFIFNEFFKG